MPLPFLIAFLSMQAPSGALSFEKEKIQIVIAPGECTLKGNYYFKNNSSSPCGRTLYYPFVLNDDLPFPDSVNVTDLDDGLAIPFHTSAKGITFDVSLLPFSTKTVAVEYHQRCSKKRFEYILTTTSRWQKPLKSAEFLISLPTELILDSISIPCDTISATSDGQQCLIRRAPFIPTEDLSITWRERE